MPNNQIQSLTVDGTTYDIVDKTSGYATEGYVDTIAPFEIHIVDYSGMGSYEYNDVTWAQIVAAYEAGKKLVLIVGYGEYYITTYEVLYNGWNEETSENELSDFVFTYTQSNYSGEPTYEVYYTIYHFDLNSEGVWCQSTVGDEKLYTQDLNNSDITVYPILDTQPNLSTKSVDTNGFAYNTYMSVNSDTLGYSKLILGNSTAQGTARNKQGSIQLYGSTAYKHILSGAPTADRTLTLPDNTGTIALTSDIPDTSSFLTTETDPVFSASAAAGITSTDISNWNAKSDTDEKLKWTASTSSNTYYPLQSTSTATTSTANTLNGINFYQYYNTAGGYRRLNLGNTTAWKSSGGAYGTIRLYGAAATYYGDLVPGVLGTTSGDGHISANRTWTLPDKTGTIALTSDIPTVPTIFLNDSSTTSASFYAPTTAGTSGYVLTSSGSGAPTWASIPAGVTVTLNGSTTTTPSFYAPTDAGTDGYYLKSNGSGAPTWSAISSGATYTATSPISIDSSNIISHEDSGVTAGTYDGGYSKRYGYYVPSFTIDSAGHITSATDLGQLIPRISASAASGEPGSSGALVPTTYWAQTLHVPVTYYSTLSAGNTSISITVSDAFYAYGYQYIRVADVKAYDAVTYEPVLVDWSTDYISSYQNSGSTSLTLTVSIAQAYTNNIRIYPVVTYDTYSVSM